MSCRSPSRKNASSSPAACFVFRGAIEPLDRAHGPEAQERLAWDLRRSMSAILEPPWTPTEGPDAISVRGFIYDVDTGLLDEVTASGPRESIG